MTPDTDLLRASALLKEKINATSAVDFAQENDPLRWHLGISIIGNACLRATWYSFRWFTVTSVPGRMARLFSRGNNEETALLDMLDREGIKTERHNPATGKQWQYSGVHGHYGGSCDALATWQGLRIVIECKTHNTKSFSNVVNHGLQEAKPQHYAQMCGYGYAFDCQYGLYMPMNKNDDDIAPVFVQLDFELARQMDLRAQDIITSNKPLQRITTKRTDYRCKLCDHYGVCWTNAAPEKTCRSCVHSRPAEGGEWQCGACGWLQIPRAVVRAGCPQYKVITDD